MVLNSLLINFAVTLEVLKLYITTILGTFLETVLLKLVRETTFFYSTILPITIKKYN